MAAKWYESSDFRGLVDMHINNGDERLLASFDGEKYAENMQVAGFDTVYIYATNCLGLATFPSNVAYRHQIAEKRDLFGEAVTACRKRGMNVVAYINHWSTAAYDHHPEWRVVDRNGRGTRDAEGHAGRYGVCCLNSPYRDYVIALATEICTKYPVDGLWIDMIGFWRGACMCESCKRLYREETGREIPTAIDWASPDWKRYVRFKERSMIRYLRDIRKAVEKARPGTTFSAQSSGWRKGYHLGWSMDLFGEFEYAGGDFVTSVRDQAVDCKFLRSASSHQPFEYMICRCPDLKYHTANKPLWLFRQQAYAAALHGAAFFCIDAIDPAGTLDPEVYRTLAAVRRDLAPYWAHPFRHGGRYLGDVALYFNYPSCIDLSFNGNDPADEYDEYGVRLPVTARLRAVNKTLGERHIQYEILHEKRLDELDRFPCVMLSGLAVLTKKEVEAFRDYVARGGTLYVSGATGILDDLEDENSEASLQRADFALADVMGVSLAGGQIPFRTIYLKTTGKSELFSHARPDYPLCASGPAPKVRAHADTTVLATATLPVSDNHNKTEFLSAISDPPWNDTDLPVLTEHKYGRGRCVFCALSLETEALDAVRDQFLDLFEKLLAGKRSITVKAPPCVEASVKQNGDAIYIPLLNTLAHETGAPAGEIRVTISDALLKATAVTAFPSGKATLTRQGDKAVITAADLPEFAVLTVK